MAFRRKRSLLHAETVRSVTRQIEIGLTTLRYRPEYEAIFKRLLEEALCQLRGAVRVIVHALDLEIARDALLEFRVSNCILEPTGDFAGGVIVKNHDATISVNNTLEKRFRQARPQISAMVYAAMTAKRQSNTSTQGLSWRD